jgi:hypothetical protein
VPDGSAVVGVQDEVAVLLHLDALDVVPLLGSVLEDARASGVDGDLAVALALELDAAVRAPVMVLPNLTGRRPRKRVVEYNALEEQWSSLPLGPVDWTIAIPEKTVKS